MQSFIDSSTEYWMASVVQTYLSLEFWRKAHDFLGHLVALRLLSISLQFGKFAVFPESFRFQFVISLRFCIL